MKCPTCGTSLSKEDETCWSCGTLLIYGRPKDTLQSSVQGRWKRTFSLNSELPKKTSLFIGLVALVMLILIGTLMAVIIFGNATQVTQTARNLSITSYQADEYYGEIWFFITVRNEGSTTSQGILVAEVLTDHGNDKIMRDISVAPNDNDVVMIIVQLPDGADSDSCMTSCYFQA